MDGWDIQWPQDPGPVGIWLADIHTERLGLDWNASLRLGSLVRLDHTDSILPLDY